MRCHFATLLLLVCKGVHTLFWRHTFSPLLVSLQTYSACSRLHIALQLEALTLQTALAIAILGSEGVMQC